MKKEEVKLSPLEQEVLTVLLNKKKARVRDIFSVLKTKKKVALPSIAVMLDRLFEKGLVERRVEQARGGLRYVYCPSKMLQPQEFSRIEQAVDQLIERFGSAAVSYFNGRFGGKK